MASICSRKVLFTTGLLFGLMVKAAQISPDIRIIKGDQSMLKMRVTILNESSSESPFDIQIHYRERYSIVRLTPVRGDDWNRIPQAQELAKKALNRYKSTNA
jgi:hypothetical protein